MAFLSRLNRRGVSDLLNTLGLAYPQGEIWPLNRHDDYPQFNAGPTSRRYLFGIKRGGAPLMPLCRMRAVDVLMALFTLECALSFNDVPSNRRSELCTATSNIDGLWNNASTWSFSSPADEAVIKTKVMVQSAATTQFLTLQVRPYGLCARSVRVPRASPYDAWAFL